LKTIAIHHINGICDIKKQAIEFAKKMLADKDPVDKIMRYTNLTQKEIKNLKDAN